MDYFREESITFQEFEGQVNVEQMVGIGAERWWYFLFLQIYTCHGIVLMPDKVWPEGVQYPIYFSQIRSHDNNGRLITPIADDQGDPVQMPPPPQPDSNFLTKNTMHKISPKCAKTTTKNASCGL